VSTTTKIVIATVAVAIAVSVACCVILMTRLQRQAAEIARLSVALSECGQRERSAVVEIEKQNAAIESVRVDTVIVERKIKDVEYKYVTERETVMQSLERDGTCENKINNIDYALRRFHGAELRPKDSD